MLFIGTVSTSEFLSRIEKMRVVRNYIMTNFVGVDFSTPIYYKLPFPFLGLQLPSHRFNFNNFSSDTEELNIFKFLGREKFKDIAQLIESSIVNMNAANNFYIYGTIGYGKSHILAALVCHLCIKNYRVVYIPDCGAFKSDMLSYIKYSLLWTYADKDKKISEILKLNSIDEVTKFFKNETRQKICFIVDQYNEIEKDKHEND